MNEKFIQKARENMPVIYETEAASDSTVVICPDDKAFFGVSAYDSGKKKDVFVSGESFVIDFKDHCVGYLSFVMNHDGIYLDAPVKLKFRFGETAYELSRDFSDYHGTLCPSWLQEDVITVDTVGKVELERRYCFRYVEITVLSSPRPVILGDFCVKCTTSADYSALMPLSDNADPLIAEIDRVASKTLADCMQTSYEDGPKRDRRLWIGDLRLQALTDYYLFGNHKLVRRCLYLFAACEEEGKYLPACIFQTPEVFFDDGTGITDYAMLWCVALCDYFEYTKDVVTASELFPVAQRQIELACSLIDENGVLGFPGGWDAFVDWAPDIEKRISCEGVVLYTLEKMAELAEKLGYRECSEKWIATLDDIRKKAYDLFFDTEKCAFINNKIDTPQYSVQSQVWMILGGVISGDEGREVLQKALVSPHSLKPVTPYMHHYVVEAMIKLDMKDCVSDYIKDYWGGMIKNGADTFWEAYDPKNPHLSPYSDVLINSFCHAWSCSASYFIRKYLM